MLTPQDKYLRSRGLSGLAAKSVALIALDFLRKFVIELDGHDFQIVRAAGGPPLLGFDDLPTLITMMATGDDLEVRDYGPTPPFRLGNLGVRQYDLKRWRIAAIIKNNIESRAWGQDKGRANGKWRPNSNPKTFNTVRIRVPHK